MKSLDIANTLVAAAEDRAPLTNLKLNKLVYFCQVEALRENGRPLFDDAMEAWQYGPVSRSVYSAYKKYGKHVIAAPEGAPSGDVRASRIAETVLATYGSLSAFDLVSLSHRDGGAWSLAYGPCCDNEIGIDLILSSRDMEGVPAHSETAMGAVEKILASIPNTMSLLSNS